jgi:hypothetical protein
MSIAEITRPMYSKTVANGPRQSECGIGGDGLLASLPCESQRRIGHPETEKALVFQGLDRPRVNHGEG